MDANLLITLQNYGLSEKEARVYLTVLELGTSIASTIARRAELNRVTVYTLLEDLRRRGITNEIKKDNIKYYNAVGPELLFNQLEKKYEDFKQKLPELVLLGEQFGSRPKIKFFEGFEGIKSIYEDVLTSQVAIKDKEPVISFLGSVEMDKQLEKRLNDDFIPHDLKLRNQKKNTKVLIFDKDTEYARLNKKVYDAIIIEKKLFDVSNEIMCYSTNKVAILMYNKKEKFGVIIESIDLNHSLRNMFDLIWTAYKK